MRVVEVEGLGLESEGSGWSLLTFLIFRSLSLTAFLALWALDPPPPITHVLLVVIGFKYTYSFVLRYYHLVVDPCTREEPYRASI